MNHVWYLHGFRSSENSEKVKILQQHFPDVNVVGLAYEPHAPQRASLQIDEKISAIHSSDHLIVIGTSLGGFWCRWIAHHYNVPAVLINPSLHPDQTLPVGNFSVYGDESKHISVTTQDRVDFKRYKPSSHASAPIDVFLAMNDEVIDSNQTVNELKELYPIHCYPGGFHRFMKFSDIIPTHVSTILT